MNGNSRQALFSGTEPPPEHLKLDLESLNTYLHAHLSGFKGPITVEKFRGGQSNPTYLASTPEQTFVIRKKPPGKLAPSAHDVAREYRVTRALHAVGFPVPTPHLLCEDESVLGTAFYIVEYLDGRLFWEVDLPGLDPDERRAIYDSVNETLASLHALDPGKLGLLDFGRPGNYMTRQFNRWSRQYRDAQLEDIPDMEWLMANLAQLIPESERTSLVHGDFGLHNLIIDKREPKVLGVLDWEISTIGDPLFDLAHHMMAWYLPRDFERHSVSSLEGRNLEQLGIPGGEEYIQSYLRRTGSASFDRQFYLGFALFRYAAIIQGIIKRAQSGTGANSNMLHTQDRVAILAGAARRMFD